MKKIITLLFILAFTSTSFASRILTIRNSSNQDKYFYGLEMVYDTLVTGELRTYTFIGDYIKLPPGGYITFSMISNNVEAFNFIPAPTSIYTVISNLEFGYPPADPTMFRWFFPNRYPPHKIVNADMIPQLPATQGTHLYLKGFKLAILNPDTGHLNNSDYFQPNYITSSHPHNIRETFLQLPNRNNPTLEIQEITFL